MEFDREIEVRSDAVQDIVSEVPNWMIRWGITLIFGMIALLVFFSFFIKYPDVIVGKAEITTEVPPAILVSQTSGYLKGISYADGDSVLNGDLIAELANPIGLATIQKLKLFLSNFQLNDPKAMANILEKLQNLGQLQPLANELYNNLIEYEHSLNDPYFDMATKVLNDQIRHNAEMANVAGKMLELTEMESNHAKEKYLSDSVLFSKGAIARITFLADRSDYLAQRKALLEAGQSRIRHRMAEAEYMERKNALIEQHADKIRTLEANIESSLKALWSHVEDWEMNYTFTAPIDGRLAFLGITSNNDFIEVEQPVFAIIPQNEQLLAYARVIDPGFGKIVVGQKVRLAVDNFPSHEFGFINGKVREFSSVTGEAGYVVKINIPSELITSYKKTVRYTPGMTATAEIITEDLSLFQRIFHSIRSVFEN